MSVLADRFYPRESAEFIVANGTNNIKLCQKGIVEVAELIVNATKTNEYTEDTYFSIAVHPQIADRKAIDWVFLVDTINFSFWSDHGKKFKVTFHGKQYTGYFAACACVNRALEENIPITSACYMENVTQDDAKRIFRSDDGTGIPLLEERVKVINEAGSVLQQKFGGTFYNCILQCNKSAIDLMKDVVENFESYRDFATYKGQKSVLKYSSELMEKLKEKELLQSGSEHEVELRGFSIKACDDFQDIVKAIQQKVTVGSYNTYNAAYVDNFLWLYRQKNAIQIEETVPFHRTRCIYY